ncbi:MAG: hypothetical protein VYB61_00510, partial [Verrucomicrobiota bacterium]|nr:hypothetical protein [Verrucomicrobiota bacterium]
NGVIIHADFFLPCPALRIPGLFKPNGKALLLTAGTFPRQEIGEKKRNQALETQEKRKIPLAIVRCGSIFARL